MSRTYQKFPRLKFTAYDAAGSVLGDVVAKNEHEALERARATYPDAETVAQTAYGAAPENATA